MMNNTQMENVKIDFDLEMCDLGPHHIGTLVLIQSVNHH